MNDPGEASGWWIEVGYLNSLFSPLILDFQQKHTGFDGVSPLPSTSFNALSYLDTGTDPSDNSISKILQIGGIAQIIDISSPFEESKMYTVDIGVDSSFFELAINVAGNGVDYTYAGPLFELMVLFDETKKFSIRVTQQNRIYVKYQSGDQVVFFRDSLIEANWLKITRRDSALRAFYKNEDMNIYVPIPFTEELPVFSLPSAANIGFGLVPTHIDAGDGTTTGVFGYSQFSYNATDVVEGEIVRDTFCHAIYCDMALCIRLILIMFTIASSCPSLLAHNRRRCRLLH